MEKAIFIICMLILAGCSQQPAESNKSTDVKLDSDNAKISYITGFEAMKSLEPIKNDLDYAIVIAAIKDKLDGAEPKLSDADATMAKEAYATKKKEEQAAELKLLGEKNRVEGAAYLEENAKKIDVTVTESGLQYEIIKKGSGSRPVSADKVTVRYKGNLVDGTEFNPFHKFEEEKIFPLDGVIKGWSEGIQMMREGSIFKFVLPSGLAFGEKARGKNIGPNSVLIFKVELLSIEKDHLENKKVITD